MTDTLGFLIENGLPEDVAKALIVEQEIQADATCEVIAWGDIPPLDCFTYKIEFVPVYWREVSPAPLAIEQRFDKSISWTYSIVVENNGSDAPEADARLMLCLYNRAERLLWFTPKATVAEARVMELKWKQSE